MNAPAPMTSHKVEAERRAEHEPSMDEILASIRRIISEDQAQIASKTPVVDAQASDAAAPISSHFKPDPKGASRPVSSADLGNAVERLRRALEPVIEKTAEAALVKPEPQPFVPPKPVRPAVAPVRTEDKSMPAPEVVALAPVAAEVLPVAAPEIVVVEPAEALAAGAPEVSFEAPDMAAPVARMAPPVSAFPTLERAFPGAATVLERVAAAQPVAPVPEPEPVAPPVPETGRLDSLHTPLTGPDSLLSPTADASIASSFQTLATTMLFQDKGLVEDMVREMLRPILKSWLDDNLPVMVERLVRAEIERVARGGRA